MLRGSESEYLSCLTCVLWFQLLYYVDDIPDPTCAVSQTSHSLLLVLYLLLLYFMHLLLCWQCKDFWHIEWLIHVILLQLLICIVAVPPGNINHYVYSSVDECLLFIIVAELQYKDISYYVIRILLKLKQLSPGISGKPITLGKKAWTHKYTGV